MYRFLLRPAWLLFHAVVLAGVVLMTAAGFWQLNRLDERKDFNSVLRERSQQAPLELTSVLDEIDAGTLDPSTAEWLPVTGSGTYLPDQVLEFNNSQGGRAGDNVLTALVLDDGTTLDDTTLDDTNDRTSDDTVTVIVNRGFIPLGIDVPPPPAVGVEIVGYVRPSEVRGRGGLTDVDDGEPVTEVRRIDIPRLTEQFPGDVAPVFVQLIASEPAIGPGDPSPVVLPELDNGPHLSYAIQWFIFAICVAVGWVLAVRRSLAVRARAQRAAIADSPSRADDEAANRPAQTSSS
jgi:cytochrome oxidase assembly protein ShyY1